MGFTLLMQISIGLLIFYNAFVFWPAFNNRSKINKALINIPSIAFAFGIIGVILAFLLTGEPFETLKSLTNIDSSKANLEVFGVIIYLGFLGFFLVFTKVMFSWRRIQKVILDLTGISGLALVYIMSVRFMIEPETVWNNNFTIIAFYGTTFLIGPIFLLLLISKSGSFSSQRALAGISTIIVLTQLVLIPIFLGKLKGMGMIGQDSLNLILHDYSWIFYCRLSLLLITFGVLMRSLYIIRSSKTKPSILIWPLSIALFTGVMAELGGRALFYLLGESVSEFLFIY